MGGDGGHNWQPFYQDPLRWKMQGSTKECCIGGHPRAEAVENDLCSAQMVMMHRPTHAAYREKTGEYPFSWHLANRKRLWEVRFQLRFKRVPQQQLHFGVELGAYVPVNGLARQAQKVLVSACRKAVGECYHSVGDDPAKVAGESELPSFVMPLWAFDQLIVSEAGKEPDLLGNLDGHGLCRSGNIDAYKKAMQVAVAEFSTDKVYTFCFWGASQYLDCMQWEVCGGIMPGMRVDFNKLCGQPPFYISLYELGTRETDKRHLNSWKQYYLRVEVWSSQHTQQQEGTQTANNLTVTGGNEGGSHLSQEALLALTEAYADEAGGDYGGEGYSDLVGLEVAPATRNIQATEAQIVDLLDLYDDPVGSSQVAKQPPTHVTTTDLLGLEF